MSVQETESSIELQPLIDCVVCNGTGWVCEAHREASCPRECHGREVPCEAPGCLSDWFRSKGFE